MLDRVPKDSFPIRKVWADIESAWTDPFWMLVTQEKINFLRLRVAPLLRFAPDVDIAAETFAHKVERLKLLILQGKSSADLLQSIAEDVSRLPQYVLEAPSKQAIVGLALSDDLAHATPTQLTQLITDLADEMRNKRRAESTFLKIDLPDFMAGKGYILIGPSGEPVHVEEYRRRVEKRVLDIADHHPALIAIREGRQPSLDQLVDLERVLNNELAGGEIHLSAKTVRQAYGLTLDNRLGFLGFVRYVLELDAIPDYEAVVARGFQEFITTHYYTSDQIRFLRSVQEVFLNKRHLSEADLCEAPLTSFGRNAAERFFTPAQIQEIVTLAEQLAA